MTDVKTFEGRTYLYEKIFKRVLCIGAFGHNTYYSRSLDSALLYLEPPSAAEVRELQMMDPRWVQIASHFGLCKVPDVMPYARYGHQKLEGELAWALVKENIVTSVEEFSWLAYKESCDHNRRETSAATRIIIRRMIRLMRRYGVTREQIAKIFYHQVSAFNPSQMGENLNLLEASGTADISAVFEVCKSFMWRTKPTVWSCLLNEIKARSPTEIGRFKQLLQSSKVPSIPVVHLLTALGASIDDLAQCQSLMLAMGQTDCDEPLSEIKLLAAPPHALSIGQIAQCRDYLDRPVGLRDHLQVLVEYGYGNASGVMAFQVCYKGTRSADLALWLSVLDKRASGQPLEAVAEWVRQALKGGHIDAYKFLIESIGLRDFGHFQRAEPIAKFGRQILSFLIHEKGLTSVQAIRDWYFNAYGVHDLRHSGKSDATYMLLLDDAYSRNNFAFVESNDACIYNAVHKRVVRILGHRPYPADDVALTAYSHSYAALVASEQAALLPILPVVLAQTGGILLISVLHHAWEPPDVLQTHLTALAPLIDELLAGAGPSGPKLNELEVDAVAMLYRTSTQSVDYIWPSVYGRESHLSGLKLSSHYVMKWDGAIRQLQASLERSSLLALAQAKMHADKFSRHEGEHIFDACKNLRAKRLNQKAGDPWSLAAHLGVLLAVAHSNTAVSDWLARDLEATVHMQQEGADVTERLEQLDKMFSSTLPDALDDHMDAFVRRFSDEDAVFLATRLIGKTNPPSDLSGQIQLQQALLETRKVVLEVCQRWVMRERRKFSKSESGEGATQLNAIVSKHPAGFFAKHAVDLCTRDNTTMWDETRHAHLVVFDPKQRRFAGMALVYFEPIAELHPSRKCLIIRAINPTNEMLATHTTSSIVDAFFDVATQIADDNGMTAVAFPAHRGMHLLSNLTAVEKDIEKRYIKSSVMLSYRKMGEATTESPTEWRVRPREVRGEFYAYERGQERVSTLYAIWAGNLKV